MKCMKNSYVFDSYFLLSLKDYEQLDYPFVSSCTY